MKDIDVWMTINNLRLNKSNTDFFVIGSQHRPKTVLALGLEDVYSSNAAAVIFEETSLCLKSKIAAIFKTSFFSHSTDCPYFKICI